MSLLVAAALFLVSMGPATAQPADPYAPWARVLGKYVDAQGRVDFRGVAADRADLDSFLDYVARTSPRSSPATFPDKAARVAYYINAYNALSMFNIIDSGFPERLGAVRRFVFFGAKRFTLGGERMSLYTLENDLIRPLGDERVHFALNCMSVSCPRLPREPFRRESLDATLDARAREFFSGRGNLEVLPESGQVRVSSILEFYREDFLRKAPALIAYVNKYRSQPIPDDYEVQFIEYDWTVNDRHRESSEHASR